MCEKPCLGEKFEGEKEGKGIKRYKAIKYYIWTVAVEVTESEQMRADRMTREENCEKAVFACLALCLSLQPLWRLAPN